MLQLTDGAVEVQGMEYRPIPALNTSLIPGTKVKYWSLVAVNASLIPGTKVENWPLNAGLLVWFVALRWILSTECQCYSWYWNDNDCQLSLLSQSALALSMENPNVYSPRDRKPLNRSTSNLTGVITPRTSPHMQTLVFLPWRGRGCICVKLSSSVCIFFTPPRYFFTFLRTCRDRTVWPIFVVYGSKDVFSRNLRPFWGANKIFWYFLLFFAKIVKITMVKIGKTFK